MSDAAVVSVSRMQLSFPIGDMSYHRFCGVRKWKVRTQQMHLHSEVMFPSDSDLFFLMYPSIDFKFIFVLSLPYNASVLDSCPSCLGALISASLCTGYTHGDHDAKDLGWLPREW